MITKICKKCGFEKLLEKGFYKHKQMADGYLNFCKVCVKSRIIQHRQKNIEQIRKYDRERALEPHRLELNYNFTKKWRSKNPKEYQAQNKLNNAIRDGKIQRQPCRICGRKSHGHHPDYNKPLNVDWLCAEHHKNIIS